MNINISQTISIQIFNTNFVDYIINNHNYLFQIKINMIQKNDSKPALETNIEDKSVIDKEPESEDQIGNKDNENTINGQVQSPLDMIKFNFEFIQNQYQEDYEKQELIGYESALNYIDKFVAGKNKDPEEVTKEMNKNMKEKRQKIEDGDEDAHAACKTIDYKALNSDSNFPLIITGDEGCGKTHAIIHWIMKFNNRKDESAPRNTDLDIGGDESSCSQGNLQQDASSADRPDAQYAATSARMGVEQGNPNINKNGNVVFTYFAGIESINSRTSLASLKPLIQHTSTDDEYSQAGAKTKINKPPNKEKKEISNDQNKYQSFIYNVMTKIRQVYKVDKRVEILDDQLRTQFRKWLEIANKKHKEYMDKNSKIVMILDGPENFTDEYGNEQSADWIPLTFPDKFKVLIVCKQKSKAIQHFIQRKYPILILKGLHSESAFQQICEAQNFDIHEEKETYEKFRQYVQFDSSSTIQAVSRKKWERNEAQALEILGQSSDLRKNPTFLTCLPLFGKHLFDQIKQSRSIYDLFKRIMINHYSDKSTLEKQVFLQILIYLTNTRKGLILSELEELLIEQDHFDKKLAKDAIDEFAEIFDLVYTFSPVTDQLMSQNFQFVQTINFLLLHVNEERQKILDGEIEVTDEINHRVTHGQKNIVKNICSLIENQTFSLRQIDELVFQYQKSRNWQRLKDLISSIEVFSILYNPETKHQLASYWQLLEQFKYDPVAEYNRTLEGFVQKYSPNNEEIFVILLQLSRFLRELADFETKATPQFKHPSLRGNQGLAKITLLAELERLGYDIYYNTGDKQLVEKQKKLGKKGINLDNPITREVFKQQLIKELDEEVGYSIMLDGNGFQGPQEQKDHQMLNYYYKRWLWVQFPWWCVNVFQNVSEIMELSVSLSNLRPELLEKMTTEERASFELYFSIDQENELVLQSLYILKDAKLRKQETTLEKHAQKAVKYTPTAKQIVQKMKTKQRALVLKNNQDVFAMNNLQVMKQRLKESRQREKMQLKGGMPAHCAIENTPEPIKVHSIVTRRSSRLPPIPTTTIPKSVKNIQHTYASSLKYQAQSQKAFNIQRAYSAVRIVEPSKKLQNDAFGEQKLFFDIRKQIFKRNASAVAFTGPDGDYKLSKNQRIKNEELKPRSVLSRLKVCLDKENELKRIELEKSTLKLAQIHNQRRFEAEEIKKKIEAARDEYLLIAQQGDYEDRIVKMKECEEIEAKLMVYNENMNSAEINRQRMTQILNVLQKNPANTPEFSDQLEISTSLVRKLRDYEIKGINDAKVETEQYVKEINFVMKQIEKKMLERDQVYQELSAYLERMNNESAKSLSQQAEIDQKIQGIRVGKTKEIQSKLQTDLKTITQTNQKVDIRKILKLNRQPSKDAPADDQSEKQDSKEKTAEILTKRLAHFRKSTIILKVSLAFLNEKQEYFTKKFELVSEVTNIQNPNDIESLIGIFERTKGLNRTRKQKLKQNEVLAAQKEELTEKLAEITEYLGTQSGKNQEEFQANSLQTKLADRQQHLKQVKLDYEQKISTLATAKTGLVNMARKLGEQKNLGPERRDLRDAEAIKGMTDQLLIKLLKIKMNIQNRKLEVRKHACCHAVEAQSANMIDFAFMSPEKKSGHIKAMERSKMNEVMKEFGADSSIRNDIVGLTKHMYNLENEEFQKQIAAKRRSNVKEIQQKIAKEQALKLEKQFKKYKLLKKSATMVKANGENAPELQPDQQQRNKDHGKFQIDQNLANNLNSLPQFKPGYDITPIIKIIRQRIKKVPRNDKSKLLMQLMKEKKADAFENQAGGIQGSFGGGSSAGGPQQNATQIGGGLAAGATLNNTFLKARQAAKTNVQYFVSAQQSQLPVHLQDPQQQPKSVTEKLASRIRAKKKEEVVALTAGVLSSESDVDSELEEQRQIQQSRKSIKLITAKKNASSPHGHRH